jgi:hypothetical protein
LRKVLVGPFLRGILLMFGNLLKSLPCLFSRY